MLMASKPKRPVGPWQSDRPIRLDQCSLDQLGRGLQDQISTVVNLVEAFDYPVMQKRKARGPVKSGSPFAIPIQRSKVHNSIYSKRSGADGDRRSDRSCRRDRHMAVSHLRMEYFMPIGAFIRLNFAGQVTSSLSSKLCKTGGLNQLQ